MSSRYLIPALCLGAIALACGPRAHNEASAPIQNGSTVSHAPRHSASLVKQQGAPRASKHDAKTDAKTAVAAQLYVHASDSSVRLALHVTNVGKKRVELTFPSGQTYDFVILDTLGREVWRWGNGRMFTQALRNKSLAGGETLDLEETWKESSSLAPGRYTARALLTSENYPLVQETEFIVGTTVASR